MDVIEVSGYICVVFFTVATPLMAFFLVPVPLGGIPFRPVRVEKRAIVVGVEFPMVEVIPISFLVRTDKVPCFVGGGACPRTGDRVTPELAPCASWDGRTMYAVTRTRTERVNPA